MRKLIFIIIMIMFMPLFSYGAVEYNYGDWGQCLGSRGSFFSINDNFYFEGSDLSFTFAYDTLNAFSTFYSFYKKTKDGVAGDYLYDMETRDYLWGLYGETDCKDYLRLAPYTIKDCWVDCEGDGIRDFYKDYSDDSPYPKPHTNRLKHDGLYTCDYENAEGEHTVEYGCRLVPNIDYSPVTTGYLSNYMTSYMDDGSLISNPSFATLFFSRDKVEEHCVISSGSSCWEAEFWTCGECTDEEYTDCQEDGINPNSQPYLCPCCFMEVVTRCAEGDTAGGLTSVDWGDFPICNNVIVDSRTFSFSVGEDGKITGNSGGSEDNPDVPFDEGDEGGTQQGTKDDDEIEKQASYQYTIEMTNQQTVVVKNIVFLAVMVFSIILMGFYLFELGITIFVFTSWIPGVFMAIINLFKKMGGM